MRRGFATRFNQTVVVGLSASLIDWLALVFMVQVLGVSAQVANVPSLVLGSFVQFAGNRYFVFQSTEKNVGRQAIEFAIVEVLAFILNAGLFYELVRINFLSYALARPFSSFTVFIFFSYPMWKLVFRQRSQASDKKG